MDLKATLGSNPDLEEGEILDLDASLEDVSSDDDMGSSLESSNAISKPTHRHRHRPRPWPYTQIKPPIIKEPVSIVRTVVNLDHRPDARPAPSPPVIVLEDVSSDDEVLAAGPSVQPAMFGPSPPPVAKDARRGRSHRFLSSSQDHRPDARPAPSPPVIVLEDVSSDDEVLAAGPSVQPAMFGPSPPPVTKSPAPLAKSPPPVAKAVPTLTIEYDTPSGRSHRFVSTSQDPPSRHEKENRSSNRHKCRHKRAAKHAAKHKRSRSASPVATTRKRSCRCDKTRSCRHCEVRKSSRRGAVPGRSKPPAVAIVPIPETSLIARLKAMMGGSAVGQGEGRTNASEGTGLTIAPTETVREGLETIGEGSEPIREVSEMIGESSKTIRGGSGEIVASEASQAPSEPSGSKDRGIRNEATEPEAKATTVPGNEDNSDEEDSLARLREMALRKKRDAAVEGTCRVDEDDELLDALRWTALKRRRDKGVQQVVSDGGDESSLAELRQRALQSNAKRQQEGAGPPLLDREEDLTELRLRALQSAMLKRHSARKKRRMAADQGAVPAPATAERNHPDCFSTYHADKTTDVVDMDLGDTDEGEDDRTPSPFVATDPYKPECWEPLTVAATDPYKPDYWEPLTIAAADPYKPEYWEPLTIATTDLYKPECWEPLTGTTTDYETSSIMSSPGSLPQHDVRTISHFNPYGDVMATDGLYTNTMPAGDVMASDNLYAKPEVEWFHTTKRKRVLTMHVPTTANVTIVPMEEGGHDRPGVRGPYVGSPRAGSDAQPETSPSVAPCENNSTDFEYEGLPLVRTEPLPTKKDREDEANPPSKCATWNGLSRAVTVAKRRRLSADAATLAKVPSQKKVVPKRATTTPSPVVSNDTKHLPQYGSNKWSTKYVVMHNCASYSRSHKWQKQKSALQPLTTRHAQKTRSSHFRVVNNNKKKVEAVAEVTSRFIIHLGEDSDSDEGPGPRRPAQGPKHVGTSSASTVIPPRAPDMVAVAGGSPKRAGDRANTAQKGSYSGNTAEQVSLLGKEVSDRDSPSRSASDVTGKALTTNVGGEDAIEKEEGATSVGNFENCLDLFLQMSRQKFEERQLREAALGTMPRAQHEQDAGKLPSESSCKSGESLQIVKPVHISVQPPPVVSKVTPVVSKVTPVVSKATPVVNKTTPVMCKATQVMCKATPVVCKVTPVVNKPTPVVCKAAKATQVMCKATPVVNKTTPVMCKATPVVNKPTPVVCKAAKATQVMCKATPVVNKTTPVVCKATQVMCKATPVVNKTTPVVCKATPVVNKPTPVVCKATQVMCKATPVVNKPTPVVCKAAKATPVVNKTTPVMCKATQVMCKATPVVDKTTVVCKATQVVSKATPVVDKTTPVLCKATPVNNKATPVVIKCIPVVSKVSPVSKATSGVTKAIPSKAKPEQEQGGKTTQKRQRRGRDGEVASQIGVEPSGEPALGHSFIATREPPPETPARELVTKRQTTANVPTVPKSGGVASLPTTPAQRRPTSAVTEMISSPAVVTVGRRDGLPRRAVAQTVNLRLPTVVAENSKQVAPELIYLAPEDGPTTIEKSIVANTPDDSLDKLLPEVIGLASKDGTTEEQCFVASKGNSFFGIEGTAGSSEGVIEELRKSDPARVAKQVENLRAYLAIEVERETRFRTDVDRLELKLAIARMCLEGQVNIVGRIAANLERLDDSHTSPVGTSEADVNESIRSPPVCPSSNSRPDESSTGLGKVFSLEWLRDLGVTLEKVKVQMGRLESPADAHPPPSSRSRPTHRHRSVKTLLADAGSGPSDRCAGKRYVSPLTKARNADCDSVICPFVFKSRCQYTVCNMKHEPPLN